MRLTSFLFLATCSMACTGAFAQTNADAETPAAPDIVIEHTAVYKPITPAERLSWFAVNTVGPTTLAAGTFAAGWGTLFNEPHEYGSHWDGFGNRYGMRLTGIATSNAMEAGIGAIWGEDPRYRRAGSGTPFKGRLGHIVKWTFVAPDRDGAIRPAYARFIAYSGNNFMSNSWREQSEADVSSALGRTATAFLGKIGSNTFDEFWPDFKRKVFHRKPEL